MLVQTNIGWFYMAISVGNIKLHEASYKVVSMDSSIGEAIEELEEADGMRFRGRTIEIISIE